jgi:hypothetical protein
MSLLMIFYFAARSRRNTLAELAALIDLPYIKGINIGDKRRAGNRLWEESQIIIRPNPEPDEFEDKLVKILDYLEQDKAV